MPSPTSVQLFFINISAVLITWQYPSGGGGGGGGGGDPLPILFRVRVSHDGEAYVDASGLLEDRQYVYADMAFAGYYQFQLLAQFEGVSSPPVETDYFVNGITGKGSLTQQALLLKLAVSPRDFPPYGFNGDVMFIL